MIDVLLDDDVATITTGAALIPSNEMIASAIHLSCSSAEMHIEKPHVCIRFAHNAVVQALNAQWRGKDTVTDVLSFPMQEGDPYEADEPLGDIILALPFVLQEAERLQRESQAHILHLIIHGMLHLLAYDHTHDDEARHMQAIESKVMKSLGLHEPYACEIHECL
ncbi:MAG: rRNA maturation RNase YbeY [Mariprofundaceae bacterium]|nr:rRNA maturation RNase YbeY [Mariprofundaceae bacterium]